VIPPGGRGAALRRIVDTAILGLVGCGVAALALAALGYASPDRPPAVEVAGAAWPVLGAASAGGPASRAADQPSRSAAAAPEALPRSVPVELRIPAIGVRTGLVPLGVEPDGGLQVPADFAVAGWYTLGPTPGEVGPAVIAGHVHSHRGPAVFFRLSTLRPGDLVRVAEQDGLVAVFEVYAVGEYPKAGFPTGWVYGNVDSPELRLITCGGPFDARSRSYRDNVVVYARLIAVERA
jgi:sortase (surface protein transpeptidase)